MTKNFPFILTPALWIIALLTALMPVPGYEAESFAISFTLLAAALCFQILKYPFHKPAVQKTRIVPLALSAFWLIAFTSVATSELFFVSFIYLCFFSVLPLSFFWMLLNRDRPGFLYGINAGLASILLLLSLSCLFQYVFAPSLLFYGRVHWPFANPNALAAFLSLGLFFSFGHLMLARNRLRRNIFLGLTILLMLAFLTISSRGACASLAIVALPVLYLLRAPVKANAKLYFGAAALTCAGGAFLFLNPPPGAFSPLAAITNTASGQYASLWSSPALWQGTWQIIRAHFWTGTGIGTFSFYYPAVRADDFYTAGLMAHNDPLQFWAEMGVAAPLLFYILALACLVLTMRAVRIMPPDDERRIHVTLPAAALAALMIHSHVTYNFYVLPTLMLTGLCAGYWFCAANEMLRARSDYSATMSDSTRNLFKGAAIAALCAGLFLFLMLQGSLILTDRAQKDAGKGDFTAFVKKINASQILSAGMNYNADILAASIPLGVLEDQGAHLNAAEKKTLTDQAALYLQTAAKLNPRQPDIFYDQARLYKTGHHISAAEDALNHALRLDPSHLSARQMLADLYAQEGRKPQALQTLKDGLKWTQMPKNTKNYLEQLALLSLEQGDLETHKAAMRALSGQIVARKNMTGIARNAFEPPGRITLDPPK